MTYFFNGILLGVSLAILVGPLLFALIQTTIEEGSRAGFLVAMGIWISDALFILATYFGVNYVIAITSYENFELILGIFGGLILLLIGAAIFINSPKKLPDSNFEISKNYFANAFKGFAINTFNPFTVFFWFGIMSTSVEGQSLNGQEVGLLAAGIFSTIIFTDSLKVVFAKRLQPKLTLNNIILVRKISGGALVLFGFILMARVIW